jgi:hypothetical protein
MGDNRIGLSLPHAFAPATHEFKLLQEAVDELQQPNDPQHDALTGILKQVAARRHSNPEEFGVAQVASELQERIIGRELDISSPSPGLKRCMAVLEPQDMENLLRVATAASGQSGADIELSAKPAEVEKPSLKLDSESLEFMKPALMNCSTDLSSVTVRVPAGESNPDVQGIQDANGFPVIEFVCAEETAPAVCANDEELRDTLVGLM